MTSGTFPRAQMGVRLINFTVDAEATLAFTKDTRLQMTPQAWDDLIHRDPETFQSQLEYMAKTIPSSWEFVDYIFSITEVSRAYTHQQVRTRTGSYAQQSMRVTDQGDYKFVMPERCANNARAIQILDRVNWSIREGYRELLAAGVPPEDARSILPTNIATNIVVKFNLRTLSELVASRSGGRTQSEYRRVVDGMASEVLRVHPWAEQFLYPKPRDYFAELEAYAERKFGGDLAAKGELLKIVDGMRKER